MVGLVALAFVGGSIMTGAIAFADEDDLKELACKAGKVMTGILLDDDEVNGVVCAYVDTAPSFSTYTIFQSGDFTESTTATCLEDDIAISGGGSSDEPLTGIFPSTSGGLPITDGHAISYTTSIDTLSTVDAWVVCYTP